MGRIEVGAAAIGEQELAGCAARFADALRKGERQQARDRHRPRPRRLAPIRACARHPSPAGRQLSHVAGAARAVAAETFQPMREIGIVAAEAALDDHGGDLGSLLGVAELGGGNHHAGKPGRQRQRPQALARWP